MINQKQEKERVQYLEHEYEEGCKYIEFQCEEEGYPARGCNYELRCAEARKSYDAEIEEIFAKYGI